MEIPFLPGKSIKEPSPLCLRKGDTHARHEWRVQHNRADLISGSEVDRGHGADTLSIEYYVLRTDAVACA